MVGWRLKTPGIGTRKSSEANLESKGRSCLSSTVPKTIWEV